MKFRASQAGKLMTLPKTKKARENSELSQTTKTFLDQLAIEHYYGRKYVFRNDEVRKGDEQEPEAIAMLIRNEDNWYEKNQKHYENEVLSGTPDVVGKDRVFDTKVPFTIFTFHDAEPPITETGKKTDYYWQLQVYMELTGLSKAELVYCLVNTPEEMITDKTYRAKFQFRQMKDGSDNPEYLEYADKLRWMHEYDDIPEEKRIKKFPIERSQEDIDALYDQIEKSLEYLKDWKL